MDSKFKIIMSFKILFGMISLFFIQNSYAQLTLSETADIVKSGDYYLGATPQLKLSDGSGGNINAFLDMPIKDDISWRAFFGGGDLDFFGGASAKWSPFPDFEKQPGIAFRAGLTLGREASTSFNTFRFDPIISKKLDTEYGWVTPYGSVPLAWTNVKSQSRTTMGLTAGCEYQAENSQNLKFNLELGLNLKDSFSYLAGSIIYQLDQNKGLNFSK